MIKAVLLFLLLFDVVNGRLWMTLINLEMRRKALPAIEASCHGGLRNELFTWSKFTPDLKNNLGLRKKYSMIIIISAKQTLDNYRPIIQYKYGSAPAGKPCRKTSRLDVYFSSQMSHDKSNEEFHNR